MQADQRNPIVSGQALWAAWFFKAKGEMAEPKEKED